MDTAMDSAQIIQSNECRMSLASWRRFCEECRLIEGGLTESKLELLFYDIAYIGGAGTSASLGFEDFTRALGQVTLRLDAIKLDEHD